MAMLKQRMITLFNFILVVSVYFQACKCDSSDFFEYLNSYEMGECEVVKHKNKRGLNYKNGNDKNHDKTIEIKLKTVTKNFYLLLLEDKLFNNISINSSMISNNSLGKNKHTKFYEGVLKDKPLRSSVIGYLQADTFCGTIFEGNDTYFVQPVQLLKPTAALARKVVVYKAENLNLPFESNTSRSTTLQFLSRMSNVTINSTIIREGISLENKTKDLVCEIDIVADHTLYQFFKEDSDQLSAYLYLHAKHADKIFRKTDFNMDGKPDGIRILASQIDIYKSSSDSNYPMDSATTLSEYLTKFVTREQEPRFCLSVSMSYRSFDGDAIGEAFRPDLAYTNIAGGICEEAVIDKNGDRMNLNIAAVNLRLGAKPLLPLSVTLLAFTHEIGHGFGSDHDDPMYKPCSPDKPVGKYLMHPKAIPADEQRPEFSSCSRKAMVGILNERGGCLKPKEPVCGNAIKEGDEECDCGWTTICNSIDPCCNPSDVQFPATGCKLKGNNSQCSSKEDGCCTEQCTVNQNPDFLCYSGPSKCISSHCDGISPVCPVPKENLLDRSCGMEPLICIDGKCNQSVCALKSLNECNCTNVSQECLVCCDKNNMCVPASEVGILNPAGGNYVHKAGTRCNFGIFRCDKAGNCVNPEPPVQSAKRRKTVLITVFLALLSIVAIVIFFAVIYLASSSINLENLFLLRNHI